MSDFDWITVEADAGMARLEAMLEAQSLRDARDAMLGPEWST